MTMITPSYLGETIEYSSLHACRSTLEDPTGDGPFFMGPTKPAAPLMPSWLFAMARSDYAIKVMRRVLERHLELISLSGPNKPEP